MENLRPTVRTAVKRASCETYLLISLCGVVLLSFYLDQFSAVATALVQFGVLLLVLAYRHWYLDLPADIEV